MQSETLKATVNYQDYEGTVAADRHDNRYLDDLAIKYGVDTEQYFIIGLGFNVGETLGDELGHTYVELLAVDKNKTKAGAIDFIKEYAERHDGELPYETFTIECGLEEVLLYFKRFEVVLFNKVLRNVKTFQNKNYAS